jgi:hypothetical protein
VRNVWDRNFRENKNTLYIQKHSSANRAVYEIIREKLEEPERHE